MKHLFFLFLAGTAIVSCNNSDTQQTQEAAMETKTTAACYTGNSGKDTVLLSVQVNDSKVTGQLDYRFFEKDKSSGTIDGEMRGDTLIADYRFMAEGMNSVRQVAFLKKDGSMTEGYGDMEEKDGKMLFKNAGMLRFGEGFVLTEITCQ